MARGISAALARDFNIASTKLVACLLHRHRAARQQSAPARCVRAACEFAGHCFQNDCPFWHGCCNPQAEPGGCIRGCRGYPVNKQSKEIDVRTTTSLAVLVTIVAAAGPAHADWSANVGFASDYFYRGILQAPSSASGGIDFEQGGFYAGTWAADVKDGLEVDGYFGYGGEVSGISYGVGFTGYYYTGDFDDTYQEINLSTGYGLLSVEVALGEYENFGGGTQDYTYYALTLEKNGLYGKFAGFSQDFEGEYVELGYGFSVAEIDLGFMAIFANDDLVGDAEESLVFTIGKTFDLN
jgi:hypothetical protein